MDIIMIPFHDCKKWFNEGFRTRDAHLAEHFCMDNRIGKLLVVNRPTSLAEMLLKRTSWRLTGTVKGTDVNCIYSGKDYQISRINEKMFCIDVFVPDLFKVIIEKKNWWYTAFKNKKVIEYIKKTVRLLDLQEPVLFLQNPMAINAAGFLTYKSFAFDAIDNWLYHPQMKSNHEIVAKNYKYVEKKADIIFTVSEELRETFKENKNVYWVANGVDTTFFSKAIRDHRDDEAVKVVYIGKIQDRVDFELVEECLKKFKETQFLFAGPVYSQKKVVQRLKKRYRNISFLGDVHYSLLPQLLKSIDIAIIPHIVDDFTQSMNPLKLYEYLAAGKPVVTSDIAGISGISEYVYSGSKEEFPNILGRVISEVKRERISEKDVAASIPNECKWESRTDQIINLLKNIS